MDAVKSDGPLVRIAELEIDRGQLTEYRRLLAEGIEASVAAEAGVLMLYAVSLKEDPTQIRIVEIYADRDAYEAHLEAAHFLSYKSSTASMVRSLRLVEAEPILLRAKSDHAGLRP